MSEIILVFIGAGIGGVARFILSSIVYAYTGRAFPYGTLVINLTGCFIIGFSYTVINYKFENLAPYLTAFIIVGILGGYTTFSSFSLETLNLIQKGNIFAGLSNILLSVLVGILATYAGIKLGYKLIN